MATYISVAPLTVVRTATQGYVNVYAGSPAPEDILPDDAKRLVAEGYLVKAKGKTEPAAAADAPVEIPEGEPAEKWTVPQLKAYAAREEIDLGDASSKADLVEVLVKPKS